MKRVKIILTVIVCLISFGLYAQDAESLVKQGKRANYQDKPDEAIELFNKALELDPKFSDAYSGRAFAYYRKGDNARAISDYSRVIELDPTNADVYISRGSSYNDTEKYDLALKDFNNAIELEPENARAYNNRGWAKKGLGDKDGACKDWKKSKKLGNGEAKIILRNNQC